MKKLIIKTFFFILIFCFNAIYAQGIALEFGYKSDKINKLHLGTNYRLSDAKNPLNLGCFLDTNIKNDNTFGISAQQRFYEGFEIGVNLSKNKIEPTIGINILNLLKLNTGYILSSQESGYLTFGFNIAIGEDGFYDRLNLLRM